jgi:hypothetical protein
VNLSIPEAPVVEEPAPPRRPVSPQPGAAPAESSPIRQDKRLVDRVGRVVRQDGRTLFVFDSGDTPLVLLPNMKLQQMEEIADFGRRPIRFRISGTVMEYRGQNYLMLSKVVIVPKETERL